MTISNNFVENCVKYIIDFSANFIEVITAKEIVGCKYLKIMVNGVTTENTCTVPNFSLLSPYLKTNLVRF